MVKDRVLIVGETQDSADLLRKRLFEAAKQTIGDDGRAVLTIKTKYFTVNVEVVTCARSGVDQSLERDRIDALILSDLECENALLESMLDLFETQPGVTLLCCEREARKIDEPTEDALRMWCIDHDTEFIDMGLRTTSEREKEGIDRVFEALSSYPWQMDLDEGSIGAGMSVGLPGMKFNDDFGDAIPNLDTVPMSAASAAASTAVVEENKDEKKEEKKDDEDDDAVEEATIEQFCEELAGGKKEDDELESDDFLQLMEKLTMMRNAAQKMPDAQRRQYAEQVAMAFARQLAFEDDEDEDEDNEVFNRKRQQAEDRKAAKEFDDEIQRIFTQMNNPGLSKSQK